MKQNLRHPNKKQSHLKSLASYLKQHPENVDFKLYDWLRTLNNGDLVRVYRDLISIYTSFKAGTPITRQAKSLANAACLAYGAEVPGVDPDLVVKHIDSLLEGMREAVHIEALARSGWVIVTGRLSIWPGNQSRLQVTQRGRIEGEAVDSPRTRALLGLLPKTHSKPPLLAKRSLA